MTQPLNILLVGTCDTKADEIQFIKSCIEAQGARVAIMDVGVLGKPRFTPDHSNDEVAAAAGTTIAEICASGDENTAMTRVASGAVQLTRQLYAAGKVQGMIALGGSMGTDLALDVAACLPIGVPKFVVSTISFSHLLPPDRIPADVMMILWSGGLYGLNSICKAILSQAAGAVVGAARASVMPQVSRPKIGMTSLGKSCLKYMVALKPALEARGYELVVFHSTGMGGRAFADLAGQGAFAAVLDLCLQEVSNDLGNSVVVSGKSRLEAAGLAGVPQIVAPGAADMVDFAAWAELSPHYADRPVHAHNRLIASVTTPPEERRRLARMIGQKLGLAKGPVTFLLPLHGVEEWDRPGGALHDPEGLDAFTDELRSALHPPVRLIEVAAHINDPEFAEAVLAVFDAWVAAGIVPPGRPDMG
jgi:uncharacterized protein (UPF0261 family)